MNTASQHTYAWRQALVVALVLSLAVYAAGQSASTAPAEKAATSPGKTAPTTTSAPADDASVRVSKPGTFEIHFRDTGLREAFELLSSQGHKNIVPTKDVSGKVNADLYDVTFKEALEAVLHSTGFAYQEEGNFIYVMTQEQLQKKLEAMRKLSTRAFRLAYIGAADAKALIAPALSKEGSIAVTPIAAMGIAASGTDSGGNSYASSDMLVVHDYDENIERVEKMINELDVKPEQVLIEATVLRATLNDANALGIDFNSLAGVSFTALGSKTTGDTTLKIPETVVDPNHTPSGTFRTDFAAAVPTGGATFGFIGRDVAAFVRALETVTDTTVLANPKLLVVNKQRGEVMVGNKDGYLTTTITETVSTQTVQFLETGTKLVVRPYIGKDGYVRMEIHPEDSSGSVSLVGTSALPSESTTEVTSNVLVRDGHTIVIGGLFREKTVNGKSQVPIFGNIPLLGAAFRSNSDSTVREEVIILITPHIIQQAPDEAASEQVKDDVERFRIGTRKGLQWFGRTRLANWYVERAKDSLAQGQTDAALCNLDMALSMQPRLIEAIRLKERLTRKAYWADETQDSSTRYVIQHMMMHELGKPTAIIIPPRKPLNVNRIDPAVRQSFGMEEDYQTPMPLLKLIDPKPGSPRSTSQPAKADPAVKGK
jgi:type IV pilus assembly protein PilQ